MTTDGIASDGSQYGSDSAQFGGAADARKTGLAGVIERVEEKALDLGRNTISAIDGKRSAAADTLAGAAGSLHSGAEKASDLAHNSGDRVSQLAHGAADKLQAGADYMRDHDLKAMLQSVEKFVRSNPGKALLAAGVVGFLAARAIRND